ncbi:transcription initiation factor TFIID subunit 1 [Cryptomeria japonica]|uniref:transcription initiation factor TFIID subunit 1 n=1 Tax=Cryptomeria japonica TaxID=3369 RepID=UPI0027D9D186|nr:transcription initiation factor TFIID subunit 1 [Cryptomeria japonica]XP_057815095.2 transcription initiation factor TFIID subunit 1 [Cryptomeria japonica]XP_057815096.2 transcription initiation factor TFIID subunit 1 [Cryptomeria japonica]XP_057815099.2 transcription initiation factor TFIID subunit 1 [Cryptomeria japonica]XP_057815100.2 transcription initiation factor TFIID subunit 1 [Cryptomeria japonica]XP_057815101.2 transcription initiation factor TFIID subunit 1 [Cryptomeria japonica]
MRNETSLISSEEKEEEDEEDYEDDHGENPIFGFMFGNVDNSGELDVDYLDEDAKGHLSALANKLGPSLTDLEESVKERSSIFSDTTEQEDYDKKSENAVDYEDIQEQYEGPEVQTGLGEDRGFSRDEYFYAEAALAGPSSNLVASVLDEDNYDDEEEGADEKDAEPMEIPFEVQTTTEEQISLIEAVNENDNNEDTTETESTTADKWECGLPILCKEDGKVVLRFSEIFGARESYRVGEKKRSQKYKILKDQVCALENADVLEEDEELYLKGHYSRYNACKSVNLIQQGYQEEIDDSLEDISHGNMHRVCTSPWDEVDWQGTKHSCVWAQPMKDNGTADFLGDHIEPLLSPNFYSLDQQEWEAGILWDSPLKSSKLVEADDTPMEWHDEEDMDISIEKGKNESECLERQVQTAIERSHSNYLLGYPIYVESFDQKSSVEDKRSTSSRRVWHPQMLRLELLSKMDKERDQRTEESKAGEATFGDIIKKLKKLSLQNSDLLDGSWVDKIVWEGGEDAPIAKLIFNLQDDQMLFEIVDAKEGRHLRTHAAAMFISPSSKTGETGELANQASSIARFNISNDKYYSIRKTSQQQQKSHTKKRAFHGIKIVHSLPAMRLQTMKPKLSNKDLANFHRPKALWYPHHNEVAAKEQGNLFAQGPMKIIVMSMGGKASKLHVDAAETLESVKGKAAKKLDFKPSEKIKFVYSGRELQEGMSLSQQDVRPNSILHLVRTKIHPWPKAQRLPGENKPLRPPGAFKKKSELSVKDGHIFLMEYCEERPLLLGNAGMGARLSTYYQKLTSSDQNAALLRNGSNCSGTIIQLEPTDKSPFLGDIKPGCSQSCLETNMYRAPVFPHKVASTDFLLVRSAKGKISLRRIDHLHVVGQQEPHIEVLSPGSKNVQNYMVNRLLVYIYREFRATEKPRSIPFLRANELAAQFPNYSESFLRKRLKHCADLQKGPSGEMLWLMKRNFRIPSEEELRRMVTPENVCAYESMQAGLHHLKRLGINKLTMASGLASAMNQLPDEAIALAAASHIERELQITSWNLSYNFVASTLQGRECIERLEITGSGDPSGRGLGFSYIRVAPKPPVSSALVKKKAAAARGGSAVTGTDADLRRLSMDAAREVLLKFNVDEDQIDKMTRWHRIAMVRKLSSEQAASGVKVDATTLNKFARGQRMSFLQLQQQAREKCQEIWDRQFQSLSAAENEDVESDVDANSDLDSFAGDLENLLDAEEGEDGEVGDSSAKKDKREIARGYGVRRRTSQAQAEEEIEDEEAEAAELCRMLMDDDEAEEQKKKKAGTSFKGKRDQDMQESQKDLTLWNKDDNCRKTKKVFKRIIHTTKPDGTRTTREVLITDPKEVEKYFANKNVSQKGKKNSGNNATLKGLVLKKKSLPNKDIKKTSKVTKQKDKPVREGFICGACGQSGHMRTNKRCPSYNEDTDANVEKLEGDSQKRVCASGEEVPANHASKAKVRKTPVKILQQVANIHSDVQKAEDVNLSNKLHGKTFPLKFICRTASDKSTDYIGINESNNADGGDEMVAADEIRTQLSHAKKVKISTKSKKLKESETASWKLGSGQNDVNAVQIHAHKKASEVEKEHKIPKIKFKKPKEFPSDEQRRLIEIEKEIEEQEQREKEEAEERRIQEALERQRERRAREEKAMWEEKEKKRLRDEREKEKRRLQEEEKERQRILEEENMRNLWRAEEERRIWAERQRQAEELNLWVEKKRQEEERNLNWAKQRQQEAAAAAKKREEFEKKERKKVKQKEREKMEKQRERDEYEKTNRHKRQDRRMPERDRGVKRRSQLEIGRYSSDYGQSSKRRRGGEANLSKALETIVDKLRNQTDVSFLFLKPVTKKEAPDYFNYVEHPMDLTTIKQKVKRLDYKSRDEFRQDVALIADNAHTYNDGRNPGIPPLADQLLAFCDELLETYDGE